MLAATTPGRAGVILGCMLQVTDVELAHRIPIAGEAFGVVFLVSGPAEIALPKHSARKSR